MRSFPWDSLVVSMGDDGFPIYDRDYMASDLREVYQTFFSNGIFLNTDEAFQVTTGEGMNVIVEAGKCCINGTVGYENSQRELAMQASSSQDRIDTVVLRWNANIEMRNIDMYVKTGVASATPVAPTLTRSETVYELGIADIFVTKNSGAISAARITDTRLNDERCGVVTPFAHIDTSTFYEQIQAAIDENVADLREQTNIAIELAQSAIDGTTAGNLQNQITENKTSIEENKEIEDNRWESISQTTKDKWSVIPIGNIRICSLVGSGKFTGGNSTYRFCDVYYPVKFKHTPMTIAANHAENNDDYEYRIRVDSAGILTDRIQLRSSSSSSQPSSVTLGYSIIVIGEVDDTQD